MTPRYPGAVWMPSGQDQGGNNGPVSFSWHEAVTTGTKEAIAGWVSQENACHAFVGEHGDTAQYKDFDRVAYGVLEGNYRGVVTIETWDGLLHGSELTPDGRDANHSDWDAGQCERIADMIAWADVVLGIPIHFMGNTRESGHAPHRLGVPEASGNVQIGYGPDRWTSHPGKACPGDMRVTCLRDVAIPRARVIAAAVRAGKCTWLPNGPVNVAAAYARTGGAGPTTQTAEQLEEEELMGVKDELLSAINGLSAKVDALGGLVRAESASPAEVGGVVLALVRSPEFAKISKDADGAALNTWIRSPEFSNIVAKASGGKAPVVTPPVVTPPATYTVVSGDSFSAVAKKLGVTPDQLGAANPKVTNRDNINVGDVLTVPKA